MLTTTNVPHEYILVANRLSSHARHVQLCYTSPFSDYQITVEGMIEETLSQRYLIITDTTPEIDSLHKAERYLALVQFIIPNLAEQLTIDFRNTVILDRYRLSTYGDFVVRQIEVNLNKENEISNISYSKLSKKHAMNLQAHGFTFSQWINKTVTLETKKSSTKSELLRCFVLGYDGFKYEVKVNGWFGIPYRTRLIGNVVSKES